MTKARISLAAAGIAGAALTLAASALCAQSAFPRDSSARVVRLADGVYVIIHDDATDQWPHGNTGVVVYEDGVLVVDATYLPSRARADIALIRRLTDRPVRYLVNTHWHMDHTHGNEAYRDSFPDVTILTERRTRDFTALNTRYWSRYSTAPDSPRRQAVQALEAELARGTDSTGRAHPPEERLRLERAIRQRNAELAELADVRVVVANQVFDSATTLRLGSRVVELVDRGPANSPHDVTVYLPRERVLFTGDILVQAPVPYTGMSWPLPWIEVLRELEKVPVAALVPGHGPVMRDHTYTRRVRELLETVTWQVRDLAEQGRPVEWIQDSLRVDEIRRRVPAWNDEEHDADWSYIVRALVERAWRGVRGQG